VGAPCSLGHEGHPTHCVLHGSAAQRGLPVASDAGKVREVKVAGGVGRCQWRPVHDRAGSGQPEGACCGARSVCVPCCPGNNRDPTHTACFTAVLHGAVPSCLKHGQGVLKDGGQGASGKPSCSLLLVTSRTPCFGAHSVYASCCPCNRRGPHTLRALRRCCMGRYPVASHTRAPSRCAE
jgi:hypothetical protein